MWLMSWRPWWYVFVNFHLRLMIHDYSFHQKLAPMYSRGFRRFIICGCSVLIKNKSPNSFFIIPSPWALVKEAEVCQRCLMQPFTYNRSEPLSVQHWPSEDDHPQCLVVNHFRVAVQFTPLLRQVEDRKEECPVTVAMRVLSRRRPCPQCLFEDPTFHSLPIDQHPDCTANEMRFWNK